MLGKFVSKLIQSLPTWEVTKYYGRVCIYQLKCLKYKVQTSEAWFNFKCKFMPGSLRNELECEEMVQKKVKDEQAKEQKLKKKELSSEKIISQKGCQLQHDSKKKENQRSSTSYKDMKSNSFITNDFMESVKSKKTQENKKFQEDDKFSMQDEYTKKKPRKMKQAQQ